ncbi:MULTISPECIES: hypothetical protein [unclassified Carboxylicivirga]|uniref:hypothetical protein n=1 Tax=Carboxylicivirga TaxID=1628153 RepID=UPI003D33B841
MVKLFSISFALVNHQSQHINRKSVSRFKKWSRKGYAIFGSLGHVVHIGRLSVDLVQWIGQIVLHVETTLQQALKLEQDDDDDLKELNEEALLTLVLETNDVACAVIYNEHY